MSAVTLGLLAAVVNAGQGVVSKDLTTKYPARQLVGPLLLLNCLLLLPFAPFVEWLWSPQIVVLHLVSAGLMVVASVTTWDLFDAGTASATTTAQALSPLAAASAAALLIPGEFDLAQAAAAIVVTLGVLWALQGAFAGLDRRGSVVRMLLTAASMGTLTVVARMLAELDVGVVETYVVRTAIAGSIVLALFPPHGVPRSAAPQMALRAVVVTVHHVLVLLAVQEGSPVVVQTLLATTPLMLLGYESFRARRLPAPRALAGASLVLLGVALIL
jgi:drug/metabolite transporter (DMT)-like permease